MDATSLRVVAVDARPTAQLGLVTVLKDRWPTWDVAAASSGAELTSLASGKPSDLVITSLHLQDWLEGLQVCRTAKQTWQGAATLILSDSPDPEVIFAAITSRVVDGIVRETACLPSLIRAIESVLQGFQAWHIDPPKQPHRAKSMFGHSQITQREKTILALLCRRWSNREIAEELNLAEQTVKNNLRALYGKLGVRGRSDVYARVRRNGEGFDHTEEGAISA